MHASSLKIAHCCLYPPSTNLPRMTRVVFFSDGDFQGCSSRELRHESLSQKNNSFCATHRCKTHDPTVLSFESIPACDGETHMPPVPMSRSSIDKRDKNLRQTFKPCCMQWYPISQWLHVMSADVRRRKRAECETGNATRTGRRNVPGWAGRSFAAVRRI